MIWALILTYCAAPRSATKVRLRILYGNLSRFSQRCQTRFGKTGEDFIFYAQANWFRRRKFLIFLIVSVLMAATKILGTQAQ